VRIRGGRGMRGERGKDKRWELSNKGEKWEK